MRRLDCGPVVCLLIAFGSLNAQWNLPNPVKDVQQVSDGATFTLETGTLKVQVCSD